MSKFRLATFNCENLFSRPKVLNYADNETAREPLEQLTALDALLAKRAYSAADKRRILQALARLHPYIDLNELRAKPSRRRGIRLFASWQPRQPSDKAESYRTTRP